MNLQWHNLPFRNYFGYLLLIHAGLLGKIARSRIKKSGEPKRGTYTYRKFLPGAKKFLRDEINSLPPSPMKTLMLLALPWLPVPGKIVLQMEMLSASAKTTPKYIDIMRDKEVCDRVMIFGLLEENSHFILDIVQLLTFTPTEKYLYEDVRKFRYYFWNTLSKYNWGYIEKNNLKVFLTSCHELAEPFRRVIEYGFGNSDARTLMREFNIHMTEEMRFNEHEQAQDLLQYSQVDALKQGDLKAANMISLMMSRPNRRIEAMKNNSEREDSVVNDDLSDSILNRSTIVGGIGGD
jgi:hypothetical protein